MLNFNAVSSFFPKRHILSLELCKLFTTQPKIFIILKKEPFKNIAGKHCLLKTLPVFSPWSTMFSTLLKSEIILSATFHMWSTNALDFGELSTMFIKFKIVVCKFLAFGRV